MEDKIIPGDPRPFIKAGQLDPSSKDPWAQSLKAIQKKRKKRLEDAKLTVQDTKRD